MKMDLPTTEVAAMVAQACVEVNRVWCELHGDVTRRPWSHTEDHIKNSLIRAVMDQLNGAPIGSPAESHGRWMQSKLAQGWTYGSPYDPTIKVHPNLVPWGELSQEEQYKDTLFQGLITLFMDGFGSPTGEEVVSSGTGQRHPNADPQRITDEWHDPEVKVEVDETGSVVPAAPDDQASRESKPAVMTGSPSSDVSSQEVPEPNPPTAPEEKPAA